MTKTSKSKMGTRVMAAAIAAAAMFSGIASTQAAVITNVGSQLGIGAGIRTTTVTKTLDADGDNVLGTAGYYFAAVNTGSGNYFYPPGGIDPAGIISPPTYLTITRTIGTDAQSLTTNTAIDNPTLTPGVSVADVQSGNTYKGTANGGTADLVVLTIGTGLPTFGVRIGIFNDNRTSSPFDVDAFTVTHTTVGTGGSLASTVSFTGLATNINHDNDFYFFDLKNAVSGDVFTISGTATSGTSNPGLAGITVDAISIPEPASLGLLTLGGLALLGRRRK